MIKKIILTFSFFLLVFSTNFCGKKQSVEKHAYSVPEVEMPADNISNPDRIELGKVLYFDPRLSGSNWISCATCHNPAMGWGDGLPTALGHNFQVLGRHSPSVINSAFYGLQFWDGRASTLEEQAGGPIVSPGEMNQDMDELVRELSALKGYVDLFNKAYPGEGITKNTITKAIASFERTAIPKTPLLISTWKEIKLPYLNLHREDLMYSWGKRNVLYVTQDLTFQITDFTILVLRILPRMKILVDSQSFP